MSCELLLKSRREISSKDLSLGLGRDSKGNPPCPAGGASRHPEEAVQGPAGARSGSRTAGHTQPPTDTEGMVSISRCAELSRFPPPPCTWQSCPKPRANSSHLCLQSCYGTGSFVVMQMDVAPCRPHALSHVALAGRSNISVPVQTSPFLEALLTLLTGMALTLLQLGASKSSIFC